MAHLRIGSFGTSVRRSMLKKMGQPSQQTLLAPPTLRTKGYKKDKIATFSYSGYRGSWC